MHILLVEMGYSIRWDDKLGDRVGDKKEHIEVYPVELNIGDPSRAHGILEYDEFGAKGLIPRKYTRLNGGKVPKGSPGGNDRIVGAGQ